MRSVTQLRSLGDMRTTISTHARSTPRQKGSTYLEVYLLDKEKQRLETELAMLTKRQRRIEGRLGAIEEAMEKLLGKFRVGELPCRPSPSLAGSGEQGDKGISPAPRQWRKMTVDY